MCLWGVLSQPHDPMPLVIFEQFGDSTLNFTIRAYLSSLDQRLETVHEVHTLIHERFHAEGIEIAFPQRDLHVRSVDQSISLFRQEEQPAASFIGAKAEVEKDSAV